MSTATFWNPPPPSPEGPGWDRIELLAREAQDRFMALGPVDQAIALTRQSASFVRGQMGHASPFIPPKSHAEVLADEVERLREEVRILHLERGKP